MCANSVNLQRIIELSTPKNCHEALKNMGLGSGIRENPLYYIIVIYLTIIL
jgi:hypothetical protein